MGNPLAHVLTPAVIEAATKKLPQPGAAAAMLAALDEPIGDADMEDVLPSRADVAGVGVGPDEPRTREWGINTDVPRYVT